MMGNFIFLFHINNNEYEYAECMKFMDAVCSGEAQEDQNRGLNIQYCPCNAETKIDKSILEGKGFLPWSEKPCSGMRTADPVFIFHVTCSREDDVVNLLYFCLLKGKYHNSILCVDSMNPGKTAATVPYFLYDEIEKSMHSNKVSGIRMPKKDLALQDYGKFEYFIRDANYGFIPMILPQHRIIKKFSSLIEIDEAKNTARKWGSSTGSCLSQLYESAGWLWNKEQDTDNVFKNYLPNITPKALLKKEDRKRITRQNLNAGKYRIYRLFLIFTECLCTMDGKSSVRLSKKRHQLIQTREFFETVKDVPILALYIFCLFDLFSKDDSELKKTDEEIMESLREKIFNARDMAEGLLQIIENVYHSEYHKGYFYIRIHTLENGNNDYLRQNYGGYLKTDVFHNAKERQHLLEVKVVDFSHLAIPHMFVNNFNKRKESALEEDREKYEILYDEAQKITLRSFFAPTEEERGFWQTYNSIAENIVHHYGLQAFDSFVMSNKGYFYVRSKEGFQPENGEEFYDSLSEKAEKTQDTFPGSQYEVLIPFHMELKQYNTALNVNINYTRELFTDYQVIDSISFDSKKCRKYFEEAKGSSYQEKKEAIIFRLYQEFSGRIKERETERKSIIRCSAKNIAITMTEIFCKVIMLYIAREKSEQGCFLMITDCTQAYFVEITRMFALFYDKQGVSYYMKHVQIYLSGENGEEFLIAGENLGNVIAKAEKLAFARGVSPKCVKIMHTMLKNKPAQEEESENIVPFDMVPFGENKSTLFEMNVRKALNTDIQSMDFGCKLDGLHVRIGNKIHIKTFYEAELLFHNNYYTSRFAFWLSREILKDGRVDKRGSITLVGYETYSEMLLEDVRERLAAGCKKEGIIPDIGCIIYEQKALEKFRASRALHQYCDSQFLLIVPINSTTTTHSKLKTFLQQSMDRATGKEGKKLNIAGNYGIILIGSKGNTGLYKQYWKNSGKNQLYSKVIKEKITYFIEVKGNWYEPLRCPLCFPEKNTEERPLIETNRESIVPMHAIRIKSRYRQTEKNGFDWKKENLSELDKVEKLSEFLVYGHIVRKGNHFRFYFDTERYFSDPGVKTDVIEWLKQCRELCGKAKNGEGIVYNIIVAPLHFSNASFVNAVNKYFFDDAALVLHFDIEKEFRNNVKTKYSNIITLYQNLCGYDMKATINFHYADDTIVSGGTYVRAHSLMQSLFPGNERPDHIKINIFASILVLLNRMSLDSKRNFIDDTAFFYSYVNLQISSMRNHEDACVLCKKKEEYQQLAQEASLNEVCIYWTKKSEGYVCTDVETYHEQRQRRKTREEASREERQTKRAAMRMICSHKANLLLSRITDFNEKSIEKYIFTMLLLRDGEPVEIEEMISYLKVIARPFICFSKEVKSAIFNIMLQLLSYLLSAYGGGERDGDNYEYVESCMSAVINDPENTRLMINILINRLAEMRSNFIIRKRNMEILLDYGKNLEEDWRDKFLFNYANRIKQLVFNSSDETKCLYLEYLLLYNKEYMGKKNITSEEFQFPESEETKDDFRRMIFLENTRIIVRGLKNLCWINPEDRKATEDALSFNYYLENYAQFLLFHKVVKKRGEQFVFNDQEYDKIRGMIRLRKQLDNILTPDGDSHIKQITAETEDAYMELLNNIKEASGARNGELIVPYRSSNKESSFLTLNLKKHGPEGGQNFEEDTLLRLVTQKQDYLMKHTFWVEWDKKVEGNEAKSGACVILKYSGPGKEEKEKISEIYLILRFEEVSYNELYRSVKNILIFRKDMWNTFNLASDTLLQNWMSDHFFKLQMKKARSVNHNDLDDLKKYGLDYIAGHYRNSRDKEIWEKYLSLILDSFLGYYNIKILSGGFEDFSCGCRGNCSFKELWRGMKPDIDAATALWRLDLKDSAGENFDPEKLTANLRKCWIEGRFSYPDLSACEVIILSALQSIRRHYKGNNEDRIEVCVYQEEEYFYIANHLDDNLQTVAEELEKSEKREGSGISVAVIVDICKIWYNNQNKLAYVDQENSRFIIRLPILEKED